MGYRGSPLHRHDERLFGREPRSWSSAHLGRARAPGASSGRAVARLLQRSARAVPREAVRALRARCRRADEHRRRGGRDRDQGGAPLGLSRQGRQARPRRDHRRRGQFPRPHHDHRRLLVRGRLSRRLRAVRAGLPRGAIRRPRRRRARHHREHGRHSDRADPGRGRNHRAAGRLLGRPAASLRQAQRPADPRRDPVRPWPHGQVCSPSSTKASCRTA